MPRVAACSWLRVELWDVDQVGQPQHSLLSGKPRANPLLSVAYGQQPSVRAGLITRPPPVCLRSRWPRRLTQRGPCRTQRILTCPSADVIAACQ